MRNCGKWSEMVAVNFPGAMSWKILSMRIFEGEVILIHIPGVFYIFSKSWFFGLSRG